MDAVRCQTRPAARKLTRPTGAMCAAPPADPSLDGTGAAMRAGSPSPRPSRLPPPCASSANGRSTAPRRHSTRRTGGTGCASTGPRGAAAKKRCWASTGWRRSRRCSLNGRPLLAGDNMFVAHECDVTDALAATGQRTADPLPLAGRRARASGGRGRAGARRWWLISSCAGFAPPCSAARRAGRRPPRWSGPWRDIWLERRDGVHVGDVRLERCARGRARAWSGAALGCPAIADAARRRSAWSSSAAGRFMRSCWNGDPGTGRFRRRAAAAPCAVVVAPHPWRTLPVPRDADRARRDGNAGAHRARRDRISHDRARHDRRRLPAQGQRRAGVLPRRLLDAAGSGEPARYARAHAATRWLRRAAPGMNMLRVAGTMVYEEDAFLRSLRRAGHAGVAGLHVRQHGLSGARRRRSWRRSQREARQQLRRLQARPCLAVLCGNSEVEQQAAMWGAPREQW